jgi:pantothenate kinase type III
MAQYLRKTGEHFNKALHAFGRWCHGVTSKNANVRSDMYKNIVAQIRGASKQMQQTAQKALHQNVHGFWVTLVDDFNMIREEHSEQQLDL